MNFLLNCPVEIVARLLGDWLTHVHICRLEVAICADQYRLNLMSIYQYVVLKADVDDRCFAGERMLDWLVTRRIKVSSLQLFHPLPKSAGTKLTALLSYSKLHLMRLTMRKESCALGPFVACISRFCTQIRDLDIRNYRLSRPFFEVLGGLHKLTKLRIANCTDLLAEFCDGIQCPTLDNLVISGKLSVLAQRFILIMCPNLSSFELHHADDVDLRALPNAVRSLVISDCQKIVAWNLNKNIYRLKVNGSCVTDEQILQILTQCPHLKYIDVGNNPTLSEGAIEYIGETYQAGLIGYEIAGCSIGIRALYCAIYGCNKLQNLDISSLPRETIQDNLFVAILQRCPNLRYLAVQGNAITDEALITISQMPLEWLLMKKTLGYDEQGLMALVTGCVQLRYISIDHFLVVKNPLVKLMWQRMRPLLKFL